MGSRDEDRGTGNEDMFPADDLEHLYKLGGLDTTVRIKGEELNKIIKRHHYDPNGWYEVTKNRVKKL